MTKLTHSLKFLLLGIIFFINIPLWASLPAFLAGAPLPSLAPMLERVVPGVVNIATITHIEVTENPLLRDPFFRYFFDLPLEQKKRKSSSLGSGIIVDAKRGLILTNSHVIAKADEIEVTLQDGRTLNAKLVGSDAATDIAVLKINDLNNLISLSFADSDLLKVGDFVVAIGNPFGLSQTVTSGIVSGLGRSGLGIEGYENFIQTDASINPGNSGGALVNLRGELVGMNTAILAPGGGNIGIGFAIPAKMVHAVLEQLVTYGAVRRGLFGVSVQDVTRDLSEAFGVTGPFEGVAVTKVEPDSAAAQAGLRPGDLIRTLNGKSVISAADLRNRFGLLRVGEQVILNILRNGKERQITGKIADPYQNFVPGARLTASLKGALLGRLDRQGTPAIPVGTVEPNSPAWNAGLREGDRILAVNHQRIMRLEDLASLLPTANDLYSLQIQRGDNLIQLIQPNAR